MSDYEKGDVSAVIRMAIWRRRNHVLAARISFTKAVVDSSPSSIER